MAKTKLTDQDLNALRIGIAEQEQKRLRAEDTAARYAQLQARIRLDASELRFIPVIALIPGDRLVATDDGRDFYVASVVRRIARETEDGNRPAGDWWVTLDHAEAVFGASSGRAMRSRELLLVAEDGRNGQRAEALRLREEQRRRLRLVAA